MKDAHKPVETAPPREATGWDRVWSNHPYSLAAVQAERARIKVTAALEMGLQFQNSDRVLDLACGSGHILIEVAHRVSDEVRFVGLDISGVALGLANANFKRAGVQAASVRGEWSRLPLRAASIDTVLAFMSPVPAVMLEIERVLTPTGRLFVIAPSRHSITSVWYRMREALTPDPFNEKNNYAPAELIELLGRHFVVNGWRVLHCGADRPFLGRIDRAIARVNPRWGRYIAVRCEKSKTH